MDESLNSLAWNYLAVLCGVLGTVGLLYWVDRYSHIPPVAICFRWFRVAALSTFTAMLIHDIGEPARPFWVLLLVAILGWFLLDSLYCWIAISAINRSPLPLFPRFAVVDSARDWPADRSGIRLREWLRDQGFKRRQTLSAELAEGFNLRMVVFLSDDDLDRLEVLFLPHRTGRVSTCLVFSSENEKGERVITDNYFLPFGGFYPEDWFLERRPWLRDPRRLHARHVERRKAIAGEFVAWEDEPVQDINRQRQQLEQVNTELAFLHPHNLRDDFGKITSEGRYRLWRELLSLNYLGRARRYT